METKEQNIQKAWKENNQYELTKLQPYNLTEEKLKRIKFHTEKYKTIIEILSQEGKSNKELLEEYINIQVKYKGLVDIHISLSEEGKNSNIEKIAGAILEIEKNHYLGKFEQIYNL